MYISVKYLVISLSFFFALSGDSGTSWHLVRKLDLGNVQELDADRFGKLYVVDSEQNIIKYDSLGKQLAIFSSPSMATVSQLQVTQSVNVFIFYEDAQKAILMDRFLGNARNVEWQDEGLSYITAACLSNDGNIWLFDQSDFSLKKYSIALKQVILSLPLNFSSSSDLGFTKLEERQNKLFAFSDNQVYVFNALGNLEYQHEWKEAGNSGVSDTFVWHQSGDVLEKWNFITDTISVIEQEPMGEVASFGHYCFLVNSNICAVYSLK